jgi:hypothetical protein
MFTKSELELIYTALVEYYVKLNEDCQRNQAKGRHNTGWQKSVMNKILALESKVYNLELTM